MGLKNLRLCSRGSVAFLFVLRCSSEAKQQVDAPYCSWTYTATTMVTTCSHVSNALFVITPVSHVAWAQYLDLMPIYEK